jgi:hypothetical protein
VTPRRRRGVSLVEAQVVLAVAAVLALGAVVAARPHVEQMRMLAATRAVASDIKATRSHAVARARAAGLLLERQPDGRFTVALVEDGDGDGIRMDDIRRRVDAVVEGPVDARARWGASPGFRTGLANLRSPPPDNDPVSRLDDPVRFGSRDLIACGPKGTATSGTLYLSDGKQRQFAVVVYGATCRVRVWELTGSPSAWVRR